MKELMDLCNLAYQYFQEMLIYLLIHFQKKIYLQILEFLL